MQTRPVKVQIRLDLFSIVCLRRLGPQTASRGGCTFDIDLHSHLMRNLRKVHLENEKNLAGVTLTIQLLSLHWSTRASSPGGGRRRN